MLVVEKPITLTELFDSHFPFYLSIGMTYDQFWNDDCFLVKPYRKAHELTMSRRNQELWLQGMYFYEVMCDVAPILHAFAKNDTKPQPYSKEPYPITKADVERKEEISNQEQIEKLKANARGFADLVSMKNLARKGVQDGNNNRPITN